MKPLYDEAIPEELSILVRDAAGSIPDPTAQVEQVVRRGRTRRRRSLATAATAIMLFAGIALVVPLRLGSATNHAPAGEGVATVAQRMLAWFPADKVWAGDASPTPSGSQAPSERKAGIRLPDGLVDIDGNGRLTPIPLHSAYIYPTMVVGLSQSEALIFGMRDRRQGQVQTGITAVVDMESVLVVVRADGDQLIQLGTSDGSVNLVGATEDSAFLLRGDRLVRRSLATGNEERVGAADQIAELIRQGWRVGSVESDSAVLLRTDSSGLHAMTVSLSTRARSNVALVCDITPNQKNKDSVSNLRLAPGGRYVACTYRTGDQADTAKLTVTDMTTGRRVVERDLPSSMQLSAHPNGLMAWADEHTLRLGLVALPANADRLYDLSEVLRIETVKV